MLLSPQVLDVDDAVTHTLYCSKSQFITVANIFIQCLEEIHYKLPGYVKYPENSTEHQPKDNVLDSYAMKVNALQVAVEIANAVLHVNNFIQDQN